MKKRPRLALRLKKALLELKLQVSDKSAKPLKITKIKRNDNGRPSS